jgi:hypothetical protein
MRNRERERRVIECERRVMNWGRWRRKRLRQVSPNLSCPLPTCPLLMRRGRRGRRGERGRR